MANDFQRILNSRLGIALAMALGRAMPLRLGRRLTAFAAGQIARRPALAIVRTVRANQWVVNGERVAPAQLDCMVGDTFRNTAHCLFDLYHHLGDLVAMRRLVAYTDHAQELIERGRRGEVTAVVAGLHLSNFDLVMQSFGMQGLDAVVLAAPQPTGGYRWQNDLRRQRGLQIVPASPGSIKQAIEQLQHGRIVMTGLDRPLAQVKFRPRFFGRASSLPTHHIYLAMKASVPIYVFAAIMDTTGIYRVEVSQPIFMRQDGDQRAALVRNAEAVLEVAEDFIRRAPQQWSMFYPVWPEALQEIQDPPADRSLN